MFIATTTDNRCKLLRPETKAQFTLRSYGALLAVNYRKGTCDVCRRNDGDRALGTTQ
jgi:hypothetical protein